MVRPDGQSEHQLTPRRFSVLFSLSSGFSQTLYGVVLDRDPLDREAGLLDALLELTFWPATASGSTS